MKARRTVTTLRLPALAHRELRLAAARRGTSIQKALEKAVRLWLLTGDAPRVEQDEGLALEGILSGLDVEAARRRERRKELTRDARRIRA